jgi:hypothetical protein
VIPAIAAAGELGGAILPLIRRSACEIEAARKRRAGKGDAVIVGEAGSWVMLAVGLVSC